MASKNLASRRKKRVPSADGAMSARDARRGFGILRRFFENAIQSGEIDITGKTDEEIRDLFWSFMDGLRNVELWPVIDHTRDLLQSARDFERSGESRIATLLYATWLEHWVNSIVTLAGQRRGISTEEMVEVIRETSFRSKTGWLLRMLGLARLAPKHRGVMLRLVELRNNFVHYKWKPLSETAHNELDQSYVATLQAFTKTIVYLHRYENRHFYNTSKRRVRAVMKFRAG